VRALDLLKTLSNPSKMNHRMAVEALRHASYVKMHDRSGRQILSEHDVSAAEESGIEFKFTRRGKELLAGYTERK
jgi:hypothetical protein